MAFKTFAPGVLTSSDVNTFLMRQAVITCTSSTRPASPSEGMTIYETDTNLYAFYTGTAWQYVAEFELWTPTIAAASTGWALGNGTVAGFYGRVGNYVIGRMRVVWGSTSTYGASQLRFDLPVNGANQSEERLGNGIHSDISVGGGFPVTVQRDLQTFALTVLATSDGRGNFATLGGVTSTVPFAPASGDITGFSFAYEAA